MPESILLNDEWEEITMALNMKKSAPAAVKAPAAFDKELFKRSVLYNVKTLYRKTLEEASQHL